MEMKINRLFKFFKNSRCLKIDRHKESQQFYQSISLTHI
jgi:hypothetical protein